MFAGQRHKTPDSCTKDFTTHDSNRRVLAITLVPLASVPTGQWKEGQMMPAHAAGCIIEKARPDQD